MSTLAIDRHMQTADTADVYVCTCNSRPGSEDSDTAAFQALHHLLASHQQKKLCGPIGPDVILHAVTPACHASVTHKPLWLRVEC